MAIPKEFLPYLASEMVTRIEKTGKIRFPDPAQATAKILQSFTDDSNREDQLNQEVRDYLAKYNEQIRRDGLSYQEMYQMVKRELMKKHKMISQTGKGEEGKISRDKQIELSHTIINHLAEIPEVQLTVDKNGVRQDVFRELQALVKIEAGIDQAVRQKIRSQKREIIEGSGEWEIVFKKYYLEELRKHGVV